MPRATEGFDVHIYKLLDPIVPLFCNTFWTRLEFICF